ncbi:MAG: hypothetical protein ILP14_13060 [Oscillospiraceae bacterium]|nr:hypothetical protein [Oscillospiraceae bacterium]
MKYIILPVINPVFLMDMLIGVYEKCSPDTAVVIALCDSTYEQEWVPQIINLTNEYRLNDHSRHISVSIECNQEQMEYGQFIMGIVRHLAGSCIVFASADPGLLRVDFEKEFFDQTDMAVRISRVLDQNREFEQMRAKTSILDILKKVADKFLSMEWISFIGFICALLLVCSSLLHGLPYDSGSLIILQSQHFFSFVFCIVAVAGLLMTCVFYTYSFISLAISMFRKGKIKKDRKKQLLTVLNIKFIIGCFLQSLGLFIAFGVAGQYGFPCFSEGAIGLIVRLLRMYGIICFAGAVLSGMIHGFLRKLLWCGNR